MIDEKKLKRDDLCDICNSADCANCFSDSDFEKWINAQPKVGEWIPCSERLPETDDVVLITVSNIDNNKLFVTPAVYQHPFFCTWNALAPEDKVIAWQPLPEPWEGEDDV